jgi:AraC-like DNA-binding protein
MDTTSLLTHLDDEAYDYREFASQAGYSVAQSYRRAAKAGIHHPMTACRRVLLERAAWHLTRGNRSISEHALDAGFESLEGFSRAFARAFGITPSVFRKLGPQEYRTGSRGGIHYAPGSYSVTRQGTNMTFIQRMLESHRDEVLALIDTIEARPEIADTLLPLTNPFPWDWEPNDETVSQLLVRNCTGPAPWLHAIQGFSDDPKLPLRERLVTQHDAFSQLVAQIEKEGSWDVTFVDADCEPPQVFSYVSVVHHVISFNEHARITLMQRLRALEVEAANPLPSQV